MTYLAIAGFLGATVFWQQFDKALDEQLPVASRRAGASADEMTPDPARDA